MENQLNIGIEISLTFKKITDKISISSGRKRKSRWICASFFLKEKVRIYPSAFWFRAV